MAKASPKKAKPDPRPPLPDYEARLSEEAAQRVLERRQAGQRGPMCDVFSSNVGRVQVQPHFDQSAKDYTAREVDLFASASVEFVATLETQMLSAAGVDTSDKEQVQIAIRAGHAFIAGQAPKNQTEALFAVQMWTIHCATMRMGAAFAKASDMKRLAEYGLQMNRTSRTFLALAEGLSKQRSGGKQQVEVRYVYVDARGSQNVIGLPGGAGGQHERGDQPHAPTPALGHIIAGSLGGPVPNGVPLWSEDEARDALSGPGHEREAPLPTARRRQPRSAEGSGKRAVSPRAVHTAGQSGAA